MSASFCCSRRPFWATAALAWSAALVESSTICLRPSTSFSTWISWVAIVSAAEEYCVALAASPAFCASAAITSAWRALPLSLPSSLSLALSRISDCFCPAMTLAACSRNRRSCCCASASACSSCTAGSARCSKLRLNLAPQYFHHFFIVLNMRASLGGF